jgi:IS30 family transposase
MATIQAILALHRSGHSNRKIARLLGVHRGTVAEHLRAAESQNRFPSGENATDHQCTHSDADLSVEYCGPRIRSARKARISDFQSHCLLVVSG